tara:strand:+ start:5517 stop:5999 length:483 start_codon:yes stop_codon:yes gene_type:complete
MTKEKRLHGLVTEARLEAALERLLAGKPQHTPADGRISVARVNQEATLNRGAIYHHKEFLAKAKVTIARYKNSKGEKNENLDDPVSIELSNINTELVNAKQNIKKLKQQKSVCQEKEKIAQDFAANLVARNAQLERALFDVITDNERLKLDQKLRLVSSE